MRELASMMLDLAGGLLLVAAVAVLLWPLSIPAALAAAGIGLLLLSWLPDSGLLSRRRKQVRR